jgi:hypothetical protein
MNSNTGFERFSFTPIAVASIGQVHEAKLKQGLRLAIKIQYPGIRRSIDSDVDNVASLLRLFSAIPKEIDFTPLLQEAKRQLHTEADYQKDPAAYRILVLQWLPLCLAQTLAQQLAACVLLFKMLSWAGAGQIMPLRRSIRTRH